MPRPNDPFIPEFYVYHLTVRGIPFYVGIGRSTRASDRVRFVEHQMKREAQRKPCRWSRNGLVIADLRQAGFEIEVKYIVKNVVRDEALKKELQEINRLLEEGFMLANVSHNPRCPKSASVVIEHLRDKLA